MPTDPISVVAVVGACAIERFRLAAQVSRETGREYVEAQRLTAQAAPAGPVEKTIRPATPRPGPVLDGLDGVAAPAGVVVDVPASGPFADALTTLLDAEHRVRLDDVVCVIDAQAGLEDLFREDTLAPRSTAAQAALSRPLAVVAQLELAATLVVVNWEDLPSDELQTLLAMVHHLSPYGRIRLQEAGATPELERSYDPDLVRPGWAHLLGGAFTTYLTHERVSAFRYECVRPFHPGRLHELVHDLMTPGRYGTLVRSAGHCRMATSANVTGTWSHAGPVLSLSPATKDEDLEHLTTPWADPGPMALGQDLAFIGLDMDRAALVNALDAAVLTDEEFLAGPQAWRQQLKPYL